MNIDKNTLLEMLHGNDQHDEADQAASLLPDQVDTDHHAGLLSKLGIDLPALLAKFGGGNTGGGGGLGGLLGGLGGSQTGGGNTGGGGLGGLLGGLGGGQTGGSQTGGLGGLLGQPEER